MLIIQLIDTLNKDYFEISYQINVHISFQKDYQ